MVEAPSASFFCSASRVWACRTGLLGRGLVLGTRLCKRDHGVLHVHPHLVLQPLQAELLLPVGQLVVDHLGLRRAVADRNIQVEADGVVGEVAREELPEHIGRSRR